MYWIYINHIAVYKHGKHTKQMETPSPPPPQEIKHMQIGLLGMVAMLNAVSTVAHFFCCTLQLAALSSNQFGNDEDCIMFSHYTLSRFYVCFFFWLGISFGIFLYTSLKCHLKTQSLMYKSILLIHETTRHTLKINNHKKNCNIYLLRGAEFAVWGIILGYFLTFLIIDATVCFKFVDACTLLQDENNSAVRWLKVVSCLNLVANIINFVLVLFVTLILCMHKNSRFFQRASTFKRVIESQDFVTILQ